MTLNLSIFAVLDLRNSYNGRFCTRTLIAPLLARQMSYITIPTDPGQPLKILNNQTTFFFSSSDIFDKFFMKISKEMFNRNDSDENYRFQTKTNIKKKLNH